LGHTFRPLVGLCYLSRSIWGCPNGPKMAKSRKKNCFLVALDNFFYRFLLQISSTDFFYRYLLHNGPNDLLRRLLSSLDTRLYIPPTCGPLDTFLGPLLRGAQMAPNGQKGIKKTVFWLFWTIFTEKMGLRHLAIHSVHLWSFAYLFLSIWGCPNGPNFPQNSIENLFSGCFGPFLLTKRAL
jgi:hypothetical protein